MICGGLTNGAGRTLDSRGEARKYALHYGSAQNPLATVVPDDRWPGMWRIASPDGRLSDMVNLSRAKDAAVAIAERGPPVEETGERLSLANIIPVGEAPKASPVRPKGKTVTAADTEVSS